MRIYTQCPEEIEIDTKGWLILPFSRFLYRLLYPLFCNKNRLLEYNQVYNLVKFNKYCEGVDWDIYPDYMMLRINKTNNKPIPNLMFFY